MPKLGPNLEPSILKVAYMDFKFILYNIGFGVQKHSKNALISYETAAELGDDEAMNLLGYK